MTNRPLSKLDKKIYQLIKNFHKENGFYPSMTEIAYKIDRSKSLAKKYVDRLEEQGLIVRHPKRLSIISLLPLSCSKN